MQSHQQWRRSVPLSPHPRQHLLSPEFLILANLTGVGWNPRVVLICISLMINDAEHFFRCFSGIWYSSGENSLFSSESHFLMGLFDFLESTFLSSLYILDISPLSDLGLVKILSQSVGGLFVLLTVSFALQKLFSFIRSHLSILNLTAQAIALLFRNFFLCAHVFEAFPHFLLYKFQCLWLYVEFFDPLIFNLSTRRKEWINSHSST